MRNLRSICLFVLSLSPLAASAADPQITVIVAPKGPDLFAAEELETLLKKLFSAKVVTAAEIPNNAENLVLLGNPPSNSVIAKYAGEQFANLSSQGHLLKSISIQGKNALLVGGGSPNATLWAVYELGYQFGVRSLLQGDVFPSTPAKLRLTGFNIQLEPHVKLRSWTLLDGGVNGTESWGLQDQQRLLRQLAKLKFNQVNLAIRSSQPFAIPDAIPASKEPPSLFLGQVFPVAGDTPGRSVFRGAKTFTNPDLVPTTSTAEGYAAGRKFLQGIIDEAARVGMEVELLVADATPLQLTAYSNAYGKKVKADADSKQASPPLGDSSEIVLSNVKTGVLPRVSLKGLQKAVTAKPAVVVQCQAPGDASPAAFFLSRFGFNPHTTVQSACEDLITSISGEGVPERVIKGFELIEAANDLIAEQDPGFCRSETNIILQHYNANTAPPDWWKKVRDNYVGAMNEMYRGNTRAREGARSFTLYYAKRCEFALHYMNCVEAARKAGLAKATNDKDTQAEQLEKAFEALYNAMNALADVARDQSDRGTIAALNKYAFQPLKVEFERVTNE